MRTVMIVFLVFFSVVLNAAEFRDGRWFFHYPQVSIVQVLQDIAAITPARFELRADTSGALDADFSARSLDEGIKRLLADYNYMFQYRLDPATQQRYPYVVVLGRKPERGSSLSTAAVSANPKPVSVSAKELVLRREGQQPYSTAGKINGRSVSFLVDTGASVVALSATLARRLGLRFGARRNVSTANGRTQGHQTVLPNVRLGPNFELGRVEAIILPRMAVEDQVLLGMNVLERFELIQHKGELTIRPYQ